MFSKVIGKKKTTQEVRGYSREETCIKSHQAEGNVIKATFITFKVNVYSPVTKRLGLEK